MQTSLKLGSAQITDISPSITLQKELHLQKYHLTCASNSQINIVPPTKSWNLISKCQGDAKLSLTFATPWNFLLRPASKDWKEWLSHLTAIKAENGSHELITTTNEVLVKSGPSKLAITYTSCPDVAELNIVLAPPQTEYTLAYDTLVNEIFSALLVGSASQFHSTMAHYSPVSIDFSGSYHGPRFEPLKTSQQPLSINISKAQFNSALGTNDLMLKL